jgi:glyoxylase-like metal-dependent hydrolase (beta-lactamase superfamily II)
MSERLLPFCSSLLAVLVIGLAGLSAAHAQSTPPLARMDMTKIAEDVYFFENSLGSGNCVGIITPEGVFIWDADIRTADQVLAAIRKLTDKKVRYVAISHPAGDHATGVWHYREDRPIFIATRTQMRDLFMQEDKEFQERKESNSPGNAAYKDRDLIKPDIAFEGHMTLRFGGLTFQFTDEGNAHSTSDVTVFIPQKRIMLMGDLLDTDIHPGQGESAGIFYSNGRRWIEIMDRIIARALPADTYVPGHGSVRIGRGIADIEEMRRYYVLVRNEISKMIVAGKSVTQVQNEFKLPQEIAHYRRPARLKQLIVPLYYQLIEQGYNP